MSDAPGDAGQVKIQRALEQYQHWRCRAPLIGKPLIVGRLSGGHGNMSLLLAAGPQRFVLRLDGLDPKRLGLSRSTEWHVQSAAAAENLAPHPVYFNPELGILVSEYFPARAGGENGEGALENLARLLRGIHRLPPVKYRLQPLDRARRYQGLLRERKLPEGFAALCRHLQSTSRPCLCHNDLLAANRIQGERNLVAIDWEYAASGDPWFDLAAICEGDAFTESECLRLASLYLQRQPDAAQIRRLQDYRQVYRCLAGMWGRLTGHSRPRRPGSQYWPG